MFAAVLPRGMGTVLVRQHLETRCMDYKGEAFMGRGNAKQKFHQNMKRIKAQCASYYSFPRRERGEAREILGDENNKPPEKNDQRCN